MSAIQRTTAAATCTVLDLLAEGKLPASGMVCQEEISLDAFLAKRFRPHYQPQPRCSTEPLVDALAAFGAA